MTKNEIKENLKAELKATVAKKQANTRERVEYKRNTPVGEPHRESYLRGYWNEGSCLKETLRLMQLAYGFVRGRRYWVCERFTKEPPTSKTYIRAIAYYAQATDEEIAAWLNAEVSPEERQAFELHLEEAKAKARAKRAERAASRSAA